MDVFARRSSGRERLTANSQSTEGKDGFFKISDKALRALIVSRTILMHKVYTSSTKTETVFNASGSITSCVGKQDVSTLSNGKTDAEPQQPLKISHKPHGYGPCISPTHTHTLFGGDS